jgi:rubrerythrin
VFRLETVMSQELGLIGERGRSTKRFFCPTCRRYLYEVEAEDHCPVCSGPLLPAQIEQS